MAQTTDRNQINNRAGSLYEQLDYDEAFCTSCSYANALVIDSREVKESVIALKNDDCCIDMDYKIYGSIKPGANQCCICADEWFNLISISGCCAYCHCSSTALDATVRAVETFSNPWRWVIVQVKADSGTPTAKLWHRGEG